MGLILPQTVKVKIHPSNYKHFKEKGYKFKKCGDIIEVNVLDLQRCSNIKIKIKCDICGKGVHLGNNVSHSHRRSNAIWNSNVKKVKCMVNGAAKRMHVCTSCLRSGNVERA